MRATVLCRRQDTRVPHFARHLSWGETMRFAIRKLTTVLAASLVGVFALSGVSSAATAGANQGVTANSVKIGFIYSKTGVASATSGDSDIGCKARVGRENAAGGVSGRKIDVSYVDDQ